ncbi:unnamed protein product [Coffea canephora]|uniref:Pentacotripeptide-repeat region of PRORP domain-containing protein n=1 Tax=Coffea canephora TaxID=49390 RepID=A0A068V2C2_COFCA|nr:unnamed protein product [Coffea canephora]
MSRSLFNRTFCTFPWNPRTHIFQCNKRIQELLKFGQLDHARKVFDSMPQRDSVTWNSMISGYSKSNRIKDAEVLFNVCQDKNVTTWTAMLSGYAKNGRIWEAIRLFEAMPERNIVSYNAMISGYWGIGDFVNARRLFDVMSEKNVSTWNSMITGYCRCGRVYEAHALFDEMPERNSVSWVVMISGYVEIGQFEEAWALFLEIHRWRERNDYAYTTMITAFSECGRLEDAIALYRQVPDVTDASLEVLVQLHRSGTSPSCSSFTSALLACSNCGDYEVGRQIHSLVFKLGYQYNTYIGNGLISMYAKSKNMEVSSLAFSSMSERDIVSWNSLIIAYVQAGEGEFACQLFLDMLGQDVKPSELTFPYLLSVSGSLCAVKLGKQIHALIFKLGWASHLFVGNGLINMYFKFGSKDGFLAFESMEERDLVTWNTVLTGCGQNGFVEDAIQIFQKMEGEGFVPDQVSFLGLLCACGRAGLVAEGLAYFSSMIQYYLIAPTIYHYTALVDLLGRAGRLSEAESIIEKMPLEPDAVILEVLLAACRIHNNIKLGQKIAGRLLQIGM